MFLDGNGKQVLQYLGVEQVIIGQVETQYQVPEGLITLVKVRYCVIYNLPDMS